MRIHISSDWHQDVYPLKGSLKNDADVVVVAGDVCQRLDRSQNILENVFCKQKVVTVAGNHSYYGSRIDKEWSRDLDRSNVHLLENSSVIIDGVRFLGCTLWTDYALYGNVIAGMSAARYGLNDHRMIGLTSDPWRRFLPEDAAEINYVSRCWLHEQFQEDHDGPTVVVTHHAPSPQSIAPKYRDVGHLNAAFSSNMEKEIMDWQPDLWIHGHTHTNFDYHIGKTRVICNPHGYGVENPSFDPNLIVEI